MSKKTIFNLFSSLAISTLSLVSISCIKYPNDNENLSFSNPLDNKNKIEEIIITNELPKNIVKIYNEEIKEIFSEVKSTYRKYRKKYFNLNRKIKSLANKAQALIADQGIPENSIQVEKFYKKWLEENGSERSNLAKLFNKYQLIFQDVDAVLSDVNIVFDNQQFIKFIKILDQRKSGIDLQFGAVQNAINSSWKFLKNNLYNENNISKKEDLEKINIEGDKNSHSHSHAIINLTYEMGLWHLLLKKNVEDKNKLKEFKDDFIKFKENVVDNIGQRNFESDYNFLIDIFENEMEFEHDNSNNLTKIEFQTKAKNIMKKIKAILLEIAKEEGLESKISW